jgi:hypothetical protein
MWRRNFARRNATTRMISGRDHVVAFVQAGRKTLQRAVLMRAAALDEEGVDP